MANIWRERTDHYSELRTATTSQLGTADKKKIEMSYISG